MDNIDKILQEIFSTEVKSPISYKEKIKKTINSLDEPDKKICIRNRLTPAIACCLLILITGSVFANEIKDIIIKSGRQTAIENGYIAYEQTNFITSKANIIKGNQKDILDTIDTSIKIDNFMMDDTYLGIEFEIKFDKKINSYKDLSKKDYENFGNIVLSDLIILDEENRILYSPSYDINSKDLFYDFCKSHNLNYQYEEFNENYFFAIYNSNIKEIDNNSNSIKFSCDINPNNNYPKSKKLFIYFKEIKFIPKNTDDMESFITISGDWTFNLNIPDIMYNRENATYKVINCSNNNFEINNIKLTEISFELDAIISNVEEPIYPEELRKIDEFIMAANNGEMGYPSTMEGLIEMYGNEEYANMYKTYWSNRELINYTGEPQFFWSNRKTDGCYVLNSNEEKFLTFGNSFGNFMYDVTHDENGYTQTSFLNKYKAHFNFNMTKYNATDKITVVIDFKGSPVYIELEKIKNN